MNHLSNPKAEDFSEHLSDELPPYWKNFISRFNNTVYGQDRAVRKIVQRLMVLSSGLHSSGRPVSPLLFAGVPSSGKTLAADTIARLWIGDSEEEVSPLIHIAGEDYAERHTAATLLGAPPGYIGHGGSSGHKRTPSPFEDIGTFEEKKTSNLINQAIGEWLKENELHKNSPKHLKEAYNRIYREELQNISSNRNRAVVLVDEFEKMHPVVQKVFLNILEKGVLRLHTGLVVDFRQSLIIFTSNIGTKEATEQTSKPPIGFQTQHHGDPENTNQEIYQIVLKKIEKELDPAIYDRIGHDGIVIFHKLSREHYARIIDKELADIQSMVSGKYHEYPALKLYFSTSFKEFILDKADKSTEGARQINRLMEKHARHLLSLYISNGELQAGDMVLFTCTEDDDGILTPTAKRCPRPESMNLEVGIELAQSSSEERQDTDEEREISSRVKRKLDNYWRANKDNIDPPEDPPSPDRDTDLL